MLRLGPEHLIDCTVNSQIADLYGGSSSSVCLQPTVGAFSGLGGLFDHAVTIGFLVMSYFFFKRSANGVVDWIDLDMKPNNDYIDVQENAYNSLNRRYEPQRSDTERSPNNTRTCPQCVGTGYFTWTDGDNTEDILGPQKCQLCEGMGTIDRLPLFRRRNESTFTLPPDDSTVSS